MIDYSPLRETLKSKDMVISDLRDKVLNSRTIAKINRGESVNLKTIQSICEYLNVSITEVVKFTKE